MLSRPTFVRIAVTALAALGFLAPAARAQLQFDPALTILPPSGGSGTWDNVTPNWSNLATDVTWNSQVAVFGYAGGTVTVASGGVSATGLTFANTGVVIAGSPVTLTGATPAISVVSGAQAAIASGLAGTTFTKTGGGTLTLAATNTGLTGTVTLTAGTLLLQDAGTLGSGALALNGGAFGATGSGGSVTNAINLVASSSVTGGNNLTFTGALTQTTASTTLTNALTGGATLTLGTVNLTNNASVRTLTISGGSTEITGSIANGGAPTSALALTGAGTLTISVAASGTYTGSTTLNAGTLLRLNTATASPLGTGVVAVASGVTASIEAVGTARTLTNTLNNQGVLNVIGSQDLTFATVQGLTGDRSLFNLSTGTVTITTLNTSTDTTNRTFTLGGTAPINVGVIQNAGGSTAGSVISLNSSTVRVTGVNSLAGSVASLGGGTVQVTNAGTFALVTSFQVGRGSVLEFNDNGTVASANRANDNAVIAAGLGAGTLRYVGRDGAASTETLGSITLGVGSLTVTSTPGAGGSNTITFGSGANAGLGGRGAVTSYNLTAGGTGYGTASTSGPPTVVVDPPPSGVTATGGAGSSTATPFPALVPQGFNYGAGYVTAPNVTLTGGTGTGATATANLSFPGFVHFGGTGLGTASNTIFLNTQATTNFLGGFATFNLVDFAAYDTTAGVIAVPDASRPADLGAAGANTNVFATGAQTAVTTRTVNSLVASGAGSNTITAGNTLTITSGGVLKAGSDSYTLSGGTIIPTAASNNTLYFTVDGTATVSSALGNNGATATVVTKSGPGTLVLNGTSGYTGTTFVNQGVLRTTSVTGTGTAGSLGGSGGGVVIAGGATFQIGGGLAFGAEQLVFAGSATQPAPVFENFAGSNTWGGAMLFNNFGVIRNSAAGSTLTLSGSSGAPSNTGAFSIQFDGAGNTVWNGSFNAGTNNTGTLFKAGSGTLTLNGNNNSQGTYNVNEGTLAVGAAFGQGTTLPIVNLNGSAVFDISLKSITEGGIQSLSPTTSIVLGTQTLTLNGANSGAGQVTNNTTFAGSISGSGGLTKTLAAASTSATNLSGSLFYTGATAVTGTTTAGNNVILRFNSSLTGAGGDITVTNATLGGSGSVNRSVVLASGGKLFPGPAASSISTFTVNGNLSFGASSNYTVDVAGPVYGVSHDSIVVGGASSVVTIDPAATLTFAVTGYTPNVADRLFILNNTTPNAISGTFNTFAEGSQFTLGGQTATITYLGNFDTGALVGGNDVLVYFSPVPAPEPATVLGIAAVAAGVVGLRRRRGGKIV